MTKKWCLAFLIILVAVLFVFAEEKLPTPYAWVNDFANVIDSEYEDKLNSLINELQEKTSSEIAVVTVESISPYSEIEYARLLFDNWKPGKKGKDNGVLVLLAIKERRWRIETGYGIEGILPDGLCGEIGRNYMVPYFKEGRYGEGLYQGVIAIAQVIVKDAKVEINGLKGLQASGLIRTSEDFTLMVGVLIFGLLWGLLFNWIIFFIGVGVLWAIFGFPTGKSFLVFLLGLFILRLLFWRIIPKDIFKKERGFWGVFLGGYSGGGLGGGGFGGGFGGFGGGGGGGGGAGGGF